MITPRLYHFLRQRNVFQNVLPILALRNTNLRQIIFQNIFAN
jgi:hypothetical protein